MRNIIPIIYSAILLTGCVGSQVYNPSLMIPGQDLDAGQVRVHTSGGPAPYTHSNDIETFSQGDYQVHTGEPIVGSFAFIGDITAQIGLQNNNTLQLRAWSEMRFPLNRWGASIGNLYWIQNHDRGQTRKIDWGIQPAFAVVGDEYSAQGWGVQLAGVARYRYSETFAAYAGIAPLYGRIPQLSFNYVEQYAPSENDNPRGDGFGLGLHLGFEHQFLPRLTGRIDISVIGQQDRFYGDLKVIPCFTLGVGFSLFKEKSD